MAANVVCFLIMCFTRLWRTAHQFRAHLTAMLLYCQRTTLKLLDRRSSCLTESAVGASANNVLCAALWQDLVSLAGWWQCSTREPLGAPSSLRCQSRSRKALRGTPAKQRRAPSRRACQRMATMCSSARTRSTTCSSAVRSTRRALFHCLPARLSRLGCLHQLLALLCRLLEAPVPQKFCCAGNERALRLGP